MKKYLLLVIICAISIMFTPLAIVGRDKSDTKTPLNEENIEVNSAANTTNATTKASASYDKISEGINDTIAVFISAENKTVDMNFFEYICGSVAAEMPLAYEDEAIKSQAVACYTNALRLKQAKDGKDGDISDDTTIHQGYINRTQRKEKWGEDFEFYEEKLQKNVKAVFGKAIYYKNNLCVAAFCAISNGKTEDAKNLWNYSIPYLKSVNSAGDKLSNKYASTVTYGKAGFIKLCEKADINAVSPDQLKINKRSKTGMVLSATLNDKTLTGEQVRKIFALRSPTFTIKADKSTITFSVRGYGHGVGLSQNGANYLAQQGYTYEEILKHYYTGITIK